MFVHFGRRKRICRLCKELEAPEHTPHTEGIHMDKEIVKASLNCC